MGEKKTITAFVKKLSGTRITPCEVKNTQIEALESAYKALIHHHPEIPKEEIPRKVFSMLVSS